MNIYTAGHSTGDLDAFVALMCDAGVEIVVDVRSKPRSRLPHFDRASLEPAFLTAGLRYRFLGDKLGGMPQDRAMIDRWRQGRLDPLIVAHLRTTETWHDGIDELSRLIADGGGRAVCVICSEAEPNECHRKAVALDVAQAIGDAAIVHLAVGKRVSQDVGLQEVAS